MVYTNVNGDDVMKKILPLTLLAVTATIIGVSVHQEYKKMKALEEELNANPLYKAKSKLTHSKNEINWKILRK